MSLKFEQFLERHSGQAGDGFSLKLIRLRRKREPESREFQGVLRTMVRSLVRIRQNRDELIAYIANRWKMDTEFAASSYDTMLRSYSPNGSTSSQSIQSVIDSIKGRNPAVGIANVVNFAQLEEVQREMKIK